MDDLICCDPACQRSAELKPCEFCDHAPCPNHRKGVEVGRDNWLYRCRCCRKTTRQQARPEPSELVRCMRSLTVEAGRFAVLHEPCRSRPVAEMILGQEFRGYAPMDGHSADGPVGEIAGRLILTGRFTASAAWEYGAAWLCGTLRDRPLLTLRFSDVRPTLHRSWLYQFLAARQAGSMTTRAICGAVVGIFYNSGRSGPRCPFGCWDVADDEAIEPWELVDFVRNSG